MRKRTFSPNLLLSLKKMHFFVCSFCLARSLCSTHTYRATLFSLFPSGRSERRSLPLSHCGHVMDIFS
ncbi:hypothetical protein L6164_016099 [Bauhinia variegata]|uniref:Uncharacterized protein n=1 Tax=Bauhinia variegata TaxID=167791 RepID=A0ACB9NN90_BAUVA|nr:hypothetical protein L6164_016099 [Bauhinia variegata]